MGCSMKATKGWGIGMAVLDILHGLLTLGFYGYQFMVNYFYICSNDLDIDLCYGERYVYSQRYALRTYIGLGEGGLTPIFDIILIVSLVKNNPCSVWFWLIKCFGIIGINIYFVSDWMIRENHFEHINYAPGKYEYHFLVAGIALTLIQVALLILFCIIAAIFTYKVAEERTRARRSLRSLHSVRSNKFRNASAPSIDGFDEDNVSYRNHALADSTNKLPLPGSNGSLDKTSHSETLRQPTEV